MKRIFYLLTVMTLLCAPPAFAQERGEERELDFQLYNGYIVNKATAGLKSEKSYFVLTDQEQFNKVFARFGGYIPKMVLLPPDPFKTKIVIATIRSGNRRLYSDVRVVARNGVLLVSYTAEDAGEGSFLTPLILTVDKDQYRAVVFRENGERAGVVRLKQGS